MPSCLYCTKWKHTHLKHYIQKTLIEGSGRKCGIIVKVQKVRNTLCSMVYCSSRSRPSPVWNKITFQIQNRSALSQNASESIRTEASFCTSDFISTLINPLSSRLYIWNYFLGHQAYTFNIRNYLKLFLHSSTNCGPQIRNQMTLIFIISIG